MACAPADPGVEVTDTASTFDAYGNLVDEVTDQTAFTIDPARSCAANRCSSPQSGTHTVTGTLARLQLSANASLVVVAAPVLPSGADEAAATVLADTGSPVGLLPAGLLGALALIGGGALAGFGRRRRSAEVVGK